jgi:hypothetical protein
MSGVSEDEIERLKEKREALRKQMANLISTLSDAIPLLTAIYQAYFLDDEEVESEE